ncbi:hypothetical protein H0B56_10735 [Haloechinothrix sp. YIM 98757]|uniref:Uncharacterized protein n=1 Tax=Haloechinothrix aidingensis TaxID=2752311 RepID=A0A838A958_9PSEU|nr:hypothetical protein [Haloechinothrix aidingensis]MBA0126018.1 hypothetical protein [Haloechinothrix aidingensis]
MNDIDEAGSGGAPGGQERVTLHRTTATVRRRRFWVGAVAVLVLSAGCGGIAGLIGGRTVGVGVAAAVGLPLLYVLVCQVRRRLWLEGSALILRTCGTRRVDLTGAGRIDVLVTEMRGARSVGLMINAHQRRRSVRIDLAVYAGDRGWELDILALRRLADALANNNDANGMVFTELLVAQLRAAAREAPFGQRPLHQLAVAAPSGKLVQRYRMEAVSKFVASLE